MRKKLCWYIIVLCICEWLTNNKWLPFTCTCIRPWCFSGYAFLIFVVLMCFILYVLAFLVPFCDVCYHFRIKMTSRSSLPPLLVGWLMSYLHHLCLLIYGVFFVLIVRRPVSCIPNVICLSWLSVFLIAPSVFSNIYGRVWYLIRCDLMQNKKRRTLLIK